MSRAKGNRIYKQSELAQFRGIYQTAVRGIPELNKMIKAADMTDVQKRKMKGTIIAVESVLERQLVMPLREESGDRVCLGCGAIVTPENEWQYCPVCGQRFRDQRVEMQADEEDPVCGRAETSAEVRAKIEAQERAKREKKREYNRKWREKNQDKIKAYQDKAKAERAAAREQS